ncbi:hypothetical protein DFA_07197 [Cavenderia fasciculata]|uniref:TraB family protein n=1 Tax=Cavenderia fasciculata TaxID=261658 RepID=F4PVR6_CACFS|nr:uncharacterized protein DFA_07197 [Cavenderia fasciculata]EGG20080.1 hypothetical protein DFA_07197 [Cavenderia fasciculata]|eukprot:XP_004367063.1 hypothetical protein DFA_07197 [Cavenderia fasciculata]
MLKNIITSHTSKLTVLNYCKRFSINSYTTTSTTSTTLSTNVNDDPIFYFRHPRLNKEIFIIGTSHVSKRSAYQVKNFIADTQPSTVVLELCQSRYDKLKAEQNVKNIQPYQQQQQQSMGTLLQQILKMLSSGRMDPGQLFQMVLSNFYNQFRLMGIIPGLEFKFAINEADRIGANIVLGDSPVNQTMSYMASALLEELLPVLTNAIPGFNFNSMMNNMGGMFGGNKLPPNMMNNNNSSSSKASMEDLKKLSEMLMPLATVLSKPTISEEELEYEFKKVMTNSNLRQTRHILNTSFPKLSNALFHSREESITKYA